MASRGRKEEKN
uniref:Uncharacterized protein n=1 Tax=Rhizophora mucronata TaxID=61149 RepID=A0A2P2QWX4_RHIMU